MNDIKIALVQICPVPGDPGANAVKMISFLREAEMSGAALAVFPECSLTGYAPERASGLALEPGSGAIRAVEAAARDYGIAVCFGFMEKTDDGCYISQEFFFNGERTVYRKTHPGSREALFFRAGNTFPLVHSPVSCGMQLCWESHIPEISAEYRRPGAELLLFPYASGMSGERCRDNWQVHLPARASDNGCFAAACNLLTEVTEVSPENDPGGGTTAENDPGDRATAENKMRGGGLAVWDPKGRLIASFFGTEEKLITAEIGGELPRDVFLREQQGLAEHDMHALSYFDLKRNELF